jgi:amidase
VARSVRDAAGPLNALHGNEPGDLFLIAPPVRPYLDEISLPTPKLRIGMFYAKPGVAVHPECVGAVQKGGHCS